MKPKAIKYYDWFKDIEPELVKNINKILAKQNIDPVKDLRGGYFKDGKWVKVLEGEHRDFWHVYLACFGENIRNDNYVLTYFPDNYDEEWEYFYDLVKKEHGDWATVLLDATRKMLQEHKFYDENKDVDPVLIWFSW